MISIDYSWSFAKNISNFVSLPWKLHNRYCHNQQSGLDYQWPVKLHIESCQNAHYVSFFKIDCLFCFTIENYRLFNIFFFLLNVHLIRERFSNFISQIFLIQSKRGYDWFWIYWKLNYDDNFLTKHSILHILIHWKYDSPLK